MKRNAILCCKAIGLCVAAMLLGVAPAVRAEDVLAPPPATPLPPIVITELQTGSSQSASEEFIELYNTTAHAIDLAEHHWQVQLASSSATDWQQPYRSIDLTGTLAPGTYYLIASTYTKSGQAVAYLSAGAQATFSAGLSATAGHMRLLYTANQIAADSSCALATTVVDELEWSAPKAGVAATPSLDGRSVFVAPSSSGLPAGQSLQRQVANGVYLDTENDAADFSLGDPTTGQASASADVTTPDDTSASAGEAPAPQDECVMPLAAGGGPPPPDSQPPTTGGMGSTDGSAVDTGPTLPASDDGLAPPQITELLPDPAAPQTDSRDEFIELYNPNDVPFDLAGFELNTGTTTQHTYVFPEGTVLPAQSFAAFFSAQTHLSLSNTGGQARLLAPQGNMLDETDVYGGAKSGQVWALAGDGWQWSTTPTPGAANVVTEPALAATVAKPVTPKASPPKVTVKTVTAAKATSKTTKPAVKAASTKVSKAKVVSAATSEPAAAKPASSPLHPGVLALVALFAVLYGAYEYRHDLANKFRQFRSNRTAGRKGG